MGGRYGHRIGAKEPRQRQPREQAQDFTFAPKPSPKPAGGEGD